jgi:hypothetical protein
MVINRQPYKIKTMNLGIIASSNAMTPVANAGPDQIVSRFSPLAVLDGSASSGPITSTTWTLLNPTSSAENGFVMMPDKVRTPAINLAYRTNTVPSGYGPGEYIYQLSVTDGVNVSTDTCKVTVQYTDMPPQRTTFRYANSTDVANIENANLGDLILDGANDGDVIGGLKNEIYIPASANWTLGPGQKVLIKGGKYARVLLNFNDNLVVGAPGNPVIITNYDGQVEVQRGFSVKNVKYAKITGKYVPGVSGDASYIGHANGNYAFRRGTYGIFANNCFINASSPGIEISGKEASFTELEYCEAGNGGFAGIYIKSDDSSALTYNGLDVHDMYIHDTSGEGVYIGTTSNNNPQQLTNFKFHNNRIIRAANEGIQIGQQAGGGDIYNNVVFMAATRWVSPFNDTQCFGAQWGCTNGNNKFRNNIVIGAGEQLASFIQQRVASGITESTIANTANNNVFYGSKGFIGNYIADTSGVSSSRSLTMNGNYSGQHFFQQDKVYQTPYSHAINTQQQIRSQLTNMTLSITNFTIDNTKTTALSGPGSISGTVVTSSFPEFNWNAGFDKTYHTNYSRWAYVIYNSYGDEYGTYSYTKQGQLFTYNLGDLVMWQGKLYTSNINGNLGNMPNGVTDYFWTKLTWTKDGVTYDYPPDDFRELDTDYYASRNIGLEDRLPAIANIAPTANAGADASITLPTNTTSLNGSGSDSDGTITSYLWSKLSGPAGGTISSPTSATTNITALQEGTYVFRLTVTDNLGLTGTDTVSVVVAPAPPPVGQFLTTVNGWNAYVHLPDDYNSNPSTYYPTIIFFPGLGEVGTTASKVIQNGPGAYIAQGWNGNVTASSTTVKFIVISLQPSSAYPTEFSMNSRLSILKSTYRIDTTKMHLTGLSHGGWCASTFVTGDALGGPFTYAGQVASVVNVQGVTPNDNTPYPNLFDNFADVGGRYLGFEQVNDGRYIDVITNRMNARVPNSGIWVSTNFGNGGHCCWNQFYGGQGVQPTAFTLDGISQNIYQWMAKESL